MNWHNYIVADETVLVGKPTIKGTRLSVEFTVKLFAAGWSEQQVLENYPRLKPEHLQAVFSYIYDNIQDNLLYSDSLKTA